MVHTFKCLGRFFALDVNSGSLFETDELTNLLINAVDSPNEVSEGEFLRYSESEILEAKQEIDSLIKQNVLFSKQADKPLNAFDGVIKSMCLNISHKCNLMCGYCFAGGGSYYGKELNMPLDTAKKAVDFLIEKSGGRKTLEIDFFGGEPLLNFDVIKETVEYAKSLEKESGKVFRFTLTTNAVLLDDDAIDFLNKEMYNVVISIDGRKDVHNQVRKTAGGKDSFDVILKNALNFKSKRGDKQYYIRGTFTSKNLDFASDALALNDLGFDQISLEPVVLPASHPLAINKEHLSVLCEEYERLAKEYLLRRKSDKWFSFFHFVTDLNSGPCHTKRLKSCGAGCEYVAVTPNGNIYPCHQFASNEDYKIGNLHDKIFSNDIPQKFTQNNVLQKSECMNCWAKYFCSGGCAANNVSFNGSLINPVKESCELMKKRTECALAIYSIETND